MRAGNLDRLIEIQRRTTGLDLYGTSVETWNTFPTMRAQFLKNATDDREGERGHTTDAVLTFRMYYFASLSLNDRLLYEGQQLEITQINEIGRRVGMDLPVSGLGHDLERFHRPFHLPAQVRRRAQSLGHSQTVAEPNGRSLASARPG